MKNILFIAAILCSYLCSAQAKDTLFLVNGDTIACKINRVTPQVVEIEATFHDGIKSRKIFERNKVLRYSGNNIIEEEEYSFEPNDMRRPNKIRELPFKEKYLFAIPYLGGSYSPHFVEDGADPAEKQFYNKLNLGFEFGLLAGRHFNKNMFYGANFQQFSSSSSLDNVIVYDNLGNTIRTGSISASIRSYNVGPVFGHKFVRRVSPHAFGLFYSLGYSHYREKSYIDAHKLATSGSAYGMVSFNYESNLLSNTSLFISTAFIVTTFSDFKVKNEDTGETTSFSDPSQAISLVRLNVSVGVRFR